MSRPWEMPDALARFHTLALLVPDETDEWAGAIAKQMLGEKGWCLMPQDAVLTRACAERCVAEKEDGMEMEMVDADRGIVRVRPQASPAWIQRHVRVLFFMPKEPADARA